MEDFVPSQGFSKPPPLTTSLALSTKSVRAFISHTRKLGILHTKSWPTPPSDPVGTNCVPSIGLYSFNGKWYLATRATRDVSTQGVGDGGYGSEHTIQASIAVRSDVACSVNTSSILPINTDKTLLTCQSCYWFVNSSSTIVIQFRRAVSQR